MTTVNDTKEDEINKEVFYDTLSYNSFLEAIILAKKLEKKIKKNKNKAIALFDDEIIKNPVIIFNYDGFNTSIRIQSEIDEEESENHWFSHTSYFIFGYNQNSQNSKLYSRKKDVLNMFKRISIYKKI